MLNLGNITFGITVNTQGLQQGARVLEGFGKRVDNAMQKQAKGFDYNTEALRRQEGAAVRALQQVQNMSAKIQSMRLDPQVKLDNINRLAAAYDQLARKMATPINRTLDPLSMQRATLGFKDQIDQVNRSLLTQQTVADTAAKHVTAALLRQEQAAMRAQQQVQSLNDQILRAAASGAISGKSADAFMGRANNVGNTFNASMMGGTALDSKAFLSQQLQMKSGLQSLQRDFMATAKSTAPLKAGVYGFTDALALTAGPLNGMVFRLRAGRDMMNEYGVAIGGTVALLSGLALGAFSVGKAVLDVTIQYQKAEQTLKGLLNNTAMATAELSYLREVADQSGLAFADLAPQFSRFVSAAQGSGQALSETNEQFKQMALLSGTLHLTTDEVNRVMLAFDQMLSAGKIMGDDMKQLRNVLPAAYEAAGQAAEKMGTSFKNASGKINDLNPSEFISNLLDVYVKMFNIDLDKPISTLQASLTRITNSWQEFIMELSNAASASEKFMAIFDEISFSLDWMGNNIELVVSSVAALTGGLTGLFAVMAGMAIIRGAVVVWAAFNAALVLMSTTLVTARVAMFGYQTATVGAALTTTQLTAAQNGLNVAMSANPIGIVVKALAILAGALWAAKSAYDATNDAMMENHLRMMDTSGIDAYIESSKKKGKQIEQVTKQLRAQVNEHLRLMAVEAAKSMNDLAGMQSDRAKLNQPLGGLQSIETGIKYGTFNLDTMKRMLDIDIKAQEGLVAEYQKNVAELHGRGSALTGIGLLPDDDTLGGGNRTLGGGGKDKNSKTPNEDRGLRALNDIINRARDANQALENMWRGPTHAGLIGALNEVQRRLFDMDTDQLKRLGELLTAANIDVSALGGLESALMTVEMRTRSAEDAVKKFSKVWEDLQDGQQQLQDLNREIEYLAAGGNPDKMWLVQAGNKARETIRNLVTQDLPTLKTTLESLTKGDGTRALNDNAISQILEGASTSDQASLMSLNKALKEMGYAVASSGDEAADAQANLESFYSTVDSGNSKLQAASGFFKQFNEDVRRLGQQQKALSATSLDQLLNIELFNQASEATKHLDEVALTGLAQQLQGLGYVGNDVNAMLTAFYKTMENNEEVITRQKEAMQTLTDNWVDFADNAIGSLQEVLVEGESFRDSMLNIIRDLGNTILNAAIFDPLKQNLRNVVTDMMSGKSGVGAGDIVSVLGNGVKNIFGMGTGIAGGESAAEGVATPGLNAVNDAANAAAGALQGNFLQGIFQSIMGVTTKTTADQVAASASLGTTMSLYSLSVAASVASAALYQAAAASTAQSIGSSFTSLGSLGFADGGFVSGAGGPTSDSIRAWLSNGEFVVNADATKKNLGLLHQINAGGKVGLQYASGGVVGPDMMAGGPQMSGLTSQKESTKIDARSTFNFSGSANEADFEKFKQLVDERDKMLREDLPYLVDERVIDSASRGRI